MSAASAPARSIVVEPLTGDAFAPFGQVIEIPTSGGKSANDGTAMRFDDVAALDLSQEGGRPLLSLFRADPCRLPLTVGVLERHPLSSQAFLPLNGRPFLIVVAPPGDAVSPTDIRAFRATPGQGVNYAPGVWHHALLALEDVSDFAVIGRAAPDTNCDFLRLDGPVVVTAAASLEPPAP
ncbi:ureidoglycolate lyase [Pseudochelatococcus sp. B33]